MNNAIDPPKKIVRKPSLIQKIGSWSLRTRSAYQKIDSIIVYTTAMFMITKYTLYIFEEKSMAMTWINIAFEIVSFLAVFVSALALFRLMYRLYAERNHPREL